jgi:hypothetical protein
MKYPFIVLAVAVSACATQPAANVQTIGQSQQPPSAVAQCVALKWATSSGQPVYTEYVYANNTAFNVYPPGQQAPGGAAAEVRPAPSGPGSWVGFRGAGGDAATSINQCL